MHVPNSTCSYRADTFFTKEPETIEWMNEFGGGTLFDIGANIGTYSLYYAKLGLGTVYAFEPSFFNLHLLAKNIHLNNLQSKINIISNPLNNVSSISNFNLSNLDEGGALSSFGVDHGHDGKPLEILLSYGTLGLGLDFMIENHLLLEIPSLIKIDVDGIEHLILEGAKKTLSDVRCRSVLIEVNENFKIQSNLVREILTGSGFTLLQKLHSSMFEDTKFSNTYNQIWIKP